MRPKVFHWRNAAFSLVELLAVVVVLAVIFSIALPSLVGARVAARGTESTVTHRQLLASISAYSTDFKDAFPYLQTPGNPMAPVRWQGETLPTSYFGATIRWWPNLLIGSYLDNGTGLEIDREATERANTLDGVSPELIRSRFWLSATTAAAARYWDEDSPPDELTLYRGTRHGDVNLPAQKGLLVDIGWETFAPRPGTQMSVGACDGSASVIPWPAESGATVDRSVWGSVTWPVISTRHGLAGRDF